MAWMISYIFDVILIDPPWKYHVETDYKLLEDKELAKNLPLEKLLDRDGFLYMWVVNAKIPFVMK